jgi:hypothetical protein
VNVLKRYLSEAFGSTWLATGFVAACAIALGIQMDGARRFESPTHRYSMVFPLGWKALPRTDQNIHGLADAYFGDKKGHSAAVFVHEEATEPRGVAENILAQAKSDDGEVEIKERRKYEKDGKKFERVVFFAGEFGHHYTFVYASGKEFVISANCVKRDFQANLKSFDSIAESLNMSDDACRLR